MKSLLQWMNRQFTGHEAHPVAAEAAATAVTATAVAVALPLVAPAAPAPKPAPKMHLRAAQPEAPQAAKPSLPQILFTGGPELKISVKAGTVYGTCPHAECESRWNVRERLLRHKLSATNSAEPKALTCPSCDKAVAIPQTVDLRKLS